MWKIMVEKHDTIRIMAIISMIMVWKQNKDDIKGINHLPTWKLKTCSDKGQLNVLYI